MSSGFRVSIPNNVRKTIHNIKEIARNHSDEEIYAMLKECSMDPNETVQKLLLQDTFHEVKRKRDRKEKPSSKEPADSRWRPGAQGRGGRSGRGNYSPRLVTPDAGEGRNADAGKENGVNQGKERVGTHLSLPSSQDPENKLSAPVAGSENVANGPTGVAYGSSSDGNASQLRAGTDVKPPEDNLAVHSNRSGTAVALPVQLAKIPNLASGIGVTCGQSTPNSDCFQLTTAPGSGIYSSTADPAVVLSLDSGHPGGVGKIKREVGSECTTVEQNTNIPPESKSSSDKDFAKHLQINKVASLDAIESELSLSVKEKTTSEIRDSMMHGNMPSKSQRVDKNQLLESSQVSSTSSQGGSFEPRPPSNYNSRSQQLTAAQKAVGPNKEWKPKQTNPNVTPASESGGASEVAAVTAEAGARSLPPMRASTLEEASSKLQKKLEELHFSDCQHVIIPNHLQVPEAERSGLSFGSFDACFGVSTCYVNSPDSDKSSAPLSESSIGIEETTEEPSSSNQNASPTVQEEGHLDNPQPPVHVPENLSSGDGDGSSSAIPEYDLSKQVPTLPAGGPPYSVVHTAPNYGFGFMPPIIGSQLVPFESSEPQSRDVSRLPSIIVQQPFDPSGSFYTQFYRPGADGDGRFSPFLSPGAATKYNGNIAMLSPQTGQSSPQESGNSLVLSTAGPTPHVTQAAGVMQSSIAVNQQPIPVFRQPGGVHISHYPPNYIPYGHYYSPFYVPPPAIHQFLSNSAFPQQPPTGSVYPHPPAAAATGVKYSLPQYKLGTNTGNTNHIGTPTGFGQYSSTPAGYNPSPAVSTGISTTNEDLTASQFKENGAYMTGQQTEGSAVWIPAAGRDIAGLPASSFYNLAPQGQHVTFAATQTGHGAFAGIYHPGQTVAPASAHPLLQPSQTMAGPVEMAGPPAGVYQQPQRAQINWTNNY